MADELTYEQWKEAARRAREGSLIPGTTVEQPAVGQGEAAVRAFEKGAALGWGDEIKGLQAASGLPGRAHVISPNPVPMLVRTAAGALRMIWSPEARETYGKTRDTERERGKLAERQHPATSTIGEIAGGAALPMPALAQGARLGPYALRMLGAGAGYGGLQAAGEAQGAPGAGEVGIGAGIGGAVGGALPYLGRAANWALAQPVNYLRNIVAPQAGANRAIGQAAQELQRSGAAAQRQAITPQQMLAEHEARLIDTLGLPGQDLARSAANQSGEARALMEGITAQRSHGGPASAGREGRTVAEFEQMFGTTPSAELRERVIGEGRRNVDPMYEFARRQGAADLTQGVEGSPGLMTLLERSPALQRAARGAERALADQNAGQEMAGPTVRNLEYWDQVKRQLDDQINVAQRQGANETMRNLVGVKNALVERLDRMVPGYAQAREFAGQYLGSGRAVQAGEQLFGRTQDIHQALRAFRGLSPGDQQLYRQGLMDRVRTMASRDPNFWNKVERNSGSLQDKLRGVLTPQEFNQLEARSHIERIMQASHNALAGQSSTARQQTQRTLSTIGGAGIGYAGATASTENPWAGTGAAGTGAGLGLLLAPLMAMQDRRMATLIARGLMSRDTALLERVAQNAARSEAGVRALRELTRRLATSGSRAAATDEGQP